jgi:RNA ligase
MMMVCGCGIEQTKLQKSKMRYRIEYKKIAPYIEEKLVSQRDLGTLSIFNYTNKCAYAHEWDEYTKLCRGLILNRDTGEMVATPFPKFFNIGERPETEYESLPCEPYRIFAKMDGSLGILYRYNGEYRIASRGSFDSPQAIWATKHLQRYYDLSSLPDNLTLLFEIIYPENRIVVDYGSREALVLLAAYNRYDWTEVEWTEIRNLAHQYGLPLCSSLDNKTLDQCIDEKKTLPISEEGWVIRFSSGLRVKVKGEEYFRLSRLIQGLSPRRLWEEMENGYVSNDLLKSIPDGVMPEIRQKAEDLSLAYFRFIDDAQAIHKKFSHLESQKEFAVAINTDPTAKAMASALFAIRAGSDKGLDKAAMKAIKP